MTVQPPQQPQFVQPPMDRLFKMMSEQDASDLFITEGLPPMLKVQGALRAVGSQRLSGQQTQQLAESLLDQAQRKEFAEKSEMNLAAVRPGLGRFRVNVFRQRGEVGMVIRQIRSHIKSLDDMGLPPVLKTLMETKRGLILVTGATGSGKSTTLAAMIDYRNRLDTGHILTIEDPVEFVHAHQRCVVTHREVGIDTQSYHDAVKQALRQAPDIILIGEIRDAETMHAALTFAETGHLVMSTLHSNNANQTIERVLTFFPPAEAPQICKLMSLNLRAVVSQRLVKSVTGGRCAVLEILIGTPRVQDLVAAGQAAALKTAIEEGEQSGMQSFDQSLYQLIRAGRITEEDGLQNADSRNNLRLRLLMSEGGKAPDSNFTLEAGLGS